MISLFGRAKRLVAAVAGALWKDVRPGTLPPSMEIEPTNWCNLDCRSCQRRAITAPGSLDSRHRTLKEFQAIIDQIQPFSIELTGLGEPLMNRDYVPMLEYGKSVGATMTTFCNMTLMNEKVAAAVVAASPAQFRVSMDAASPEMYTKIRGRDWFTSVQEGIRALVAAREAAHTERPRVTACFVLQDDNFAEVVPFIDMAAESGIDSIHFQLLDMTGLSLFKDALIGKRLTGEFRQALTLAAARCREKGIASDAESTIAALLPRWEHIMNTGSRAGLNGLCLYPWLSTYITVDGNVRPCPMASPGFDDETVMGNINTTLFTEIWRGERYQAFRHQVTSGRYPSICQQCPGRTWSMFAARLPMVRRFSSTKYEKQSLP